MTIIIRLGLYIYINMYTVYIYRLPPFYFIPHGVRINQYLDLFELQRLHRKIHRSRAVQEKNWNEKNNSSKKISQLNAYWASSVSVTILPNSYYVFVKHCHIRSPAHLEVPRSICSSCFLVFVFFWRSKKIEPARCHQARPMWLS